MRLRIPKRYRRLIRREGADIVIALATGVIASMITDAINRRRKARPAADRPLSEAKHA